MGFVLFAFVRCVLDARDVMLLFCRFIFSLVYSYSCLCSLVCNYSRRTSRDAKMQAELDRQTHLNRHLRRSPSESPGVALKNSFRSKRYLGLAKSLRNALGSIVLGSARGNLERIVLAIE